LNVRIRWQFAQTISHFATSSKIRSVPARPIICVTATQQTMDGGSEDLAGYAIGLLRLRSPEALERVGEVYGGDTPPSPEQPTS
jgi:hypothetical protein